MQMGMQFNNRWYLLLGQVHLQSRESINLKMLHLDEVGAGG